MRRKLVALFLFCFLFLITSWNAFAVNQNFNIGVVLSGDNNFTFTADSPGYFQYNLLFRRSDNSEATIHSDYSDTQKNFSRTIKLQCDSGSNDGSCLSGPFIRGVFIAGEDYAVVKRFTLFCGSIQVVSEEKTNNWDEEFYKRAVRDFMNNGPASATCPTPTPTPTLTPSTTLKVLVSPTVKAKEELEDEEEVEEEVEIMPTEIPEEANKNNNWPIVLGILGVILASVLTIVGYKKKDQILKMLTSWKKDPKIAKVPVDKTTPDKKIQEDTDLGGRV